MSQPNNIDLNIPEQDLQDINAAIDTLLTKLGPHLKNLSKEDRIELPKMGDKTVAFVSKAQEYAQKNPDLVPSFLDMPALNNDMNSVQILNGFIRELLPLTEQLQDSSMLCGSEAYQGALVFYSNVKMAKKLGVTNSATIYEDLASRFPGAKGSSTKA